METTKLFLAYEADECTRPRLIIFITIENILTMLGQGIICPHFSENSHKRKIRLTEQPKQDLLLWGILKFICLKFYFILFFSCSL